MAWNNPAISACASFCKTCLLLICGVPLPPACPCVPVVCWCACFSCSGAVLAESSTPTYSIYGIVLFMGSATFEGARVVGSQLLLGPYRCVGNGVMPRGLLGSCWGRAGGCVLACPCNFLWS